MKRIGVVLLIFLMVGASISASAAQHGRGFDEVPGEPMGKEAMEETKGEGFITVMLGGAAFGALTYLADCMSRSTSPTLKGTLTSASVGAIAAVSPVVGAVAGLGIAAGSSYRVGTHYLQYEL